MFGSLYPCHVVIYPTRLVFGSRLSRIILVLICVLSCFSDVSATTAALVPKKNSSLFQLAKEERAIGHFQNSIILFEKCLSAPTNDQNIRLETLYSLAILYWNIGELKRSKVLFLESAELAKRNRVPKIEKDSLSAIEVHNLYQSGKTLRAAERYEESIAAFNEALKISRNLELPELELKCLRLLSLTYWDTDNLVDFYKLNLRALQIAEQVNHDRERGRCLNNIGAYFGRMDNYDAALDSYEKALTIATEIKCDDDIAAALSNLGGVWSDLGNYDNALKYLEKALEIDNRRKDRSSISKDLNNIGIATRLRGLATEERADIKHAESFFKEALTISEELNDGATEIQGLNNLGTVSADLQEYEVALRFFTRAALLAEQSNDTSYLGMIYNNIGVIYSYLNNFEDSNRYFDLALELSSKYRDGTFIWETYLELANLSKKQNDFKKACEYYRNSIASIEEIRSKIRIEDLKVSFFGIDKRLEAYQNIIDLLVKLHRVDLKRGYDKEAFSYLERAKARAFLDSLEFARIDISEGINPVLINREKQMMRQIAKSYSRLLSSDLLAVDREEISSQLKISEDRLESLKREIRASSPAYADLKYPKIITYDEARKMLPTSDTAFLAYSIGKDSSFCFSISSHGLKVFNVPSRKVIQEQVTAYRKAISDRQNRDFELGRALFRELVQPGLEPEIKKIMIIPDDILNLLPFEALITNDKPDSWLVRDYMIAYVPSLSSLRVLQMRHRNGSNPRKDLLAIGNPSYGSGGQGEGKLVNAAMVYDLNSGAGVDLPPLKYSALEVENISGLFRPAKVTVLQKEAASIRWLKSHSLSDYKIIHFATHSIIDDKKPARSAILLSYAQNQAGNGLLQTRDVYNLKLNSDLVTLSACQSGLGQFIRGEGIEGLSRAFFYAGSSSVLMSLWSVNDQATYLLMERFYRHLKGSESLMGALRNAKLEMIDSRMLSHPYFWAGFVINGKADGQVFPGFPYAAVSLVVIAALCLLLMAGITARRRRALRESASRCL